MISRLATLTRLADGTLDGTLSLDPESSAFRERFKARFEDAPTSLFFSRIAGSNVAIGGFTTLWAALGADRDSDASCPATGAASTAKYYWTYASISNVCINVLSIAARWICHRTHPSDGCK